MRKLLTLVAALLGFCLGIATPAYAAPTCAVGLTTQPPVANLSFPAVTLEADGSALVAPIASYNLYQGTASGAETKSTTTLVPGTVNVLKVGLLQNTTYYWFVTAVDTNGVEGLPSTEGCKQFPATKPGATTLTITMLEPIPRWFG